MYLITHGEIDFSGVKIINLAGLSEAYADYSYAADGFGRLSVVLLVVVFCHIFYILFKVLKEN